ncbi:MAG: hypothetical protein QXN21_02835 [Candidatus Bathyarchaeia archaeon]
MTTENNASFKYISGLTWKSIVAIMFSAIFISPIIIFTNLLGTWASVDVIIWVTVVLFTEIFAYLHNPLTRQEITLIYNTAWLPIYPATAIMPGSLLFLLLLYNGYFARSPIAVMFEDPFTGLPLRDVIPPWFAPRHDSPVHSVRTFLHTDWMAPVLISILSMGLSLLMATGLAIIITHLYIEEEKLPFPLANVDASICNTLGSREPFRMRALMVGAVIGLFYGFILYSAPIISNGVFGIPLTLLPIPWVDLNIHVEKVFPGASFGIATDLLTFAWGFVFPSHILASMVAGSFAVWFFGNALTLKLPYFSRWQQEWTPGMSIALIYQRATLWVWAGPQIGFVLAIAVYGIIAHYKSFIRLFKSILHVPSLMKKDGYFSLRFSLLIYFIGSLSFVALFMSLIPDFPFLVCLLMFVAYPFLFALVAGRVMGETTFSISIPYAWQGALLASGYPKVDAWFAPAPLTAGEHAILQMYIIKIMTLTDTRPSDLFKAIALIFPLSVLVSFMYVSLFWMIAPIPSIFYPGTIISWPPQAAVQALWITRQFNIFRPESIFFGFIVILSLSIASRFLRTIPLSVAAFVGGTFQTVPTPLSLLIGHLISKYILSKRIKEWEDIKYHIAGGIALGEGASIVIAISTVILARSLWSLPY